MPTDSPTPSDQTLLHDYVHTKNQLAFQTLATRHLNWIYSAALRITNDQSLAEDITQAVLLTLSQKAPKLINHPSITSWLFHATRYAALALLRSERRRKHHEESAMQKSQPAQPDPTWSDLAPHVDAAIAKLPESDRRMLLLRFYQQLTHPAIAQLLNITEEAARKRTDRALDRLRKILRLNSTTTLAALLTTSLILTAPKHLAAAAFLTTTTKTLTATKGIQTMLTLTKLKFALSLTLLALIPLTAALLLYKNNTAAQASAPIIPNVQTTTPTTLPALDPATLHSLTARSFSVDPSGKEILIAQYYFDLDHGQLAQEIHPNATEISFDDGTHRYHFRLGDNRLSQEPTDMPAQFRARMLTLIATHDRMRLDQRHPELDIATPEPLICYSEKDVMPNSPTRIDHPLYFVWYDAKGIPRQNKTVQTVHLETTPDTVRSELTYNQPIPPETWKLPTPPIMVTPQSVLDQSYPVDHALASVNTSTQTLAVHLLESDPDGTLYSIISIRMAKTPQALTHLPLPNFGNAQQAPVNTDHYALRTLAAIEAPGFHVYYVTFHPSAQYQPDNKITINFTPYDFNSGSSSKNPTAITIAIPASPPTPFRSAYVQNLFTQFDKIRPFAETTLCRFYGHGSKIRTSYLQNTWDYTPATFEKLLDEDAATLPPDLK